MASEEFYLFLARFTPYVIVTIFFLILLDAKNRISNDLTDEWDVSTSTHRFFKHGIVSALAKMYSEVISRNKESLAKLVANELSRNAAKFYNKNSRYFYKIRSDPKLMAEYFDDQELILFMMNSKIWVMNYLMRTKKGFNFHKKKIDDAYLAELTRIIDIFKNELSSHKVKVA